MRRRAHNAPAPAKDALFNTRSKRGGNGFAIAASLHALCPDTSSTVRTAFERRPTCRHQESTSRRVETGERKKYAVCPFWTKLIRVCSAANDRAMMRTPEHARSKLRSKTYGVPRQNVPSNQSINQSINHARPINLDRVYAPLQQRFCKRDVMDAMP